MRDAMGGSVVLVVIVVFIVFALGYMAFNVNYTKAFRMKNKIIAVYDEYQGDCNSRCESEIKAYAKTIGYSLGSQMSCDNIGYTKGAGGIYCFKEVPYQKGNDGDYTLNDVTNKSYYKIITKINVEVPIINNILDLKVFYITGDTATYKKRG